MLTNPKTLWHAEPPHRLVLFGVWQGMSCTADDTWAWYNSWRNFKGGKKMKILTIRLFLKMLLDSWTPRILGNVLFTIPRCSPIDNCPTWEGENEEKLTLNTSQAEPVAANSTAYSQFCFILPFLCQAVINGTASRGCFPKIHGVQESINTLKK